jgi:hypothetical protein
LRTLVTPNKFFFPARATSLPHERARIRASEVLDDKAACDCEPVYQLFLKRRRSFTPAFLFCAAAEVDRWWSGSPSVESWPRENRAISHDGNRSAFDVSYALRD